MGEPSDIQATIESTPELNKTITNLNERLGNDQEFPFLIYILIYRLIPNQRSEKVIWKSSFNVISYGQSSLLLSWINLSQILKKYLKTTT